jgi:glyoxylase-like metal-dependent hydrolase (beta-lactamase superfamily II)
LIRAAICGVALSASLILGCSGDAGQAGAGSVPGETASVLLERVVTAMGTAELSSITLSGRAWRIRNGWMQTPHASPPWPYRDEITNYHRTIDLKTPASLARGDTFASNIFLDPPTANVYVDSIQASDSAWARRLEIWLTPWGFLEGAGRNGVELSTGNLDGTEYRVLRFRSPVDQTAPSGMRYTVNGYINDDNLVAGVETWVDDPLIGDFRVVEIFSQYRPIAGVMVPQTMEQRRGGGGIFGAIITGATPNPPSLSELMVVPQLPDGSFRGGSSGEPQENVVEVAGDRVWLITGGYTALVAEFEDYVLVFEAGQSQARGEQILAEVRQLLPGKPIRYLINSHAHLDHIAGVVPFLRNGTTLVTHQNNVAFLEDVLTRPRVLLGEEPLNPRIEGVRGVAVYQDSMNRVELHSVPNGHSDGMLVAALPRQGILFQADFTLPQPDAEANPFVQTLAQYVALSGIPFNRYLGVHAASRPQTREDLLATIGL